MRRRLYISKTGNPYDNLAKEEYLLDHVGEDEVILYLWQNKHTVVIGKNQNAYKECRVNEILADGGYIARRLSGGGAVFHDLGNLNFTFVTRDRHYDVDRQLQVIIEAVASLGLPAEKSGRNDILIEGRKFSGNAFYTRQDKKYHHGTILVHADMDCLSKYLNVPADKLKSKGVSSVQSRVCNLTDFRTEISIEHVKTALIDAFEAVYGGDCAEIGSHEFALDELLRLSCKYSSEQWLYGNKITADYNLSGRFSWGGVELAFMLKGNQIVDCMVYSDAMDVAFAHELRLTYQGQAFQKDLLLVSTDEAGIPKEIKEDLKMLLTKELL